jgi:hypothetical protein
LTVIPSRYNLHFMTTPDHWLADDGLYDPDLATLLSEAEWDREIAKRDESAKGESDENL